MCLLDRLDFVVPPVVQVVDDGKGGGGTGGGDGGAATTTTLLKNRYRFRRHQSGRSFASRTPTNNGNCGSETLTFGRIVDEGLYISYQLPWEKKQEKKKREDEE